MCENQQFEQNLFVFIVCCSWFIAHRLHRRLHGGWYSVRRSMWRLFLYVNSLQERQQKNKKTAESHRDFLIHISVVSSFSCLLRYSFLCHSRQRMFLSFCFFCFAFARCARCARSSRRCHAATIRRPIHLFYAVECCRRCFVFKYFIGIFCCVRLFVTNVLRNPMWPVPE